MSASRLVYSDAVGEQMVHIVEPVASQVLEFIVEKLGYKYLFQDNIEVVSDFRSISKNKDKNGNTLIRHDRVRAKLNPNVNPFNNKWEGNGTTVDLGNGNMLITNHGGNAAKTPWGITNKFPNQKYSIFSDEDEFIDLTEMLVGSTLTMEVQMDFKDIVVATECLSRIYQCFVNGDMTGYVDIQYDYPVPMNIQKILRYLYELKGPRSADDSCWKWIKDGSDSGISMLVNRNRPEHKEVVVNKNNFQAVYQLDCNIDAPTPGDPDGAVLTFTVTVQYARANRLVLQYPIIVGNKYVEWDYVPMDPEVRQSSAPSPMMWQNPSVTKLWESYYARGIPKPACYPWWDPWMLPTDSHLTYWKYIPKLTVAFTLDDFGNPDGTTVIDLVDGLPGMKLDKEILDVIAEKKNGVLGIDNVVNVSVYADDYPVSSTLLDLSDGRNLVVKKRRGQSVCRLVVSVRPEPAKGHNWNRVWYVTFYTHPEDTVKPPKSSPHITWLKKGHR